MFEVQENSDVTYRLSGWDRMGPKTNNARRLQVNQAMACIDFDRVALTPVVPVIERNIPDMRERIFLDRHFGLSHIRGEASFTVGAANTPRVLVCLKGDGELACGNVQYGFGRGEVILLPACVGECQCQHRGNLEILEVSLPEGGAA